VQCMAVQAVSDAPSTYGEGFEAHGSAHCTPSGQVVYCLVDHDYHRCSGNTGMLPCCDDGSDPHHGSPAAPPAPTGFACAAQEADQASVEEHGDQVSVPEYDSSGTTTQQEADQVSEPDMGDQVYLPEFGSSETTTQQEADQVPEPDSGDQVSVPDGNAESPPQVGKHLEGILELKVAITATEQQSTLEACLEILSRDGSAAVRVGMASHFGVAPEDVRVFHLKPVGRRLLEDQDTHVFQISFTAKFVEGTKSASSMLAADLEEALDAADSGLTVQSAGIKWLQAEAAPTDSKPEGDTTYYLTLGIVGGVLVVLLVAASTYLAVTYRKRSSSIDLKADTTGTSVAVVSDVAMGKAAKVDDNEDLESNVPSTQDPCDAAENLSIGSDLVLK